MSYGNFRKSLVDYSYAASAELNALEKVTFPVINHVKLKLHIPPIPMC